MEFQKTVTINGIGSLEGCRLSIAAVQYDYVNGDLAFTVIGWRNAADRDSYTAARAALAEKVAAFEAACATLAALIPSEDASEEEKAQLEAQCVVPRFNHKRAAKEMGEAEDAAAVAPKLPVAPWQFRVPTIHVANQLTNGAPDQAKLLSWLKAQPGWEDLEIVE